MLIRVLPLLLLVGCGRTPAPPSPAGDASPVVVFAAASTTDVMREAGRLFEAATGTPVAFSFDSSSNLARQIKAGAPAEVFVSADERWMDDVAAAGAIQEESREDLLGNTLVLVAPAGKGFAVTMSRDFDFAATLPQVARIAVGDPAHVPAGRYARQSLEALGWWSTLEPRLVPAQDVRAALRLVELGETDAGIVYSTDAARSSKVMVVASFPPDTHEPIRYPMALCREASSRAADFTQSLRTAEISALFEQAGFTVLPARLATGAGGAPASKGDAGP